MEIKRSGQKFEEFAIAFMREAKGDLKKANDALKDRNFSDVVFHAQQCVEKIVKALLEMEHFFVREHDLEVYFSEKILNKYKGSEWGKTFLEILDYLDWFKGKWQDTRYPRLENGKVIIPEDIYDEKIAKDGLEKAVFVFEKLSAFLKEKYNIKIRE